MTGVDICNVALGYLNVPGITSFDDTSAQAVLCRTGYPLLRDRLLAEHSWSFACKSLTLSQVTAEVYDSRYPYACALPVDLIHILQVDPDVFFVRHGRTIYLHEFDAETPPVLRYVARIEDSSLFDPGFAAALTYLLASELGMAMTHDTQLVSYWRNLYAQELQNAKSADSIENECDYQSRKLPGSWIFAHRGEC